MVIRYQPTCFLGRFLFLSGIVFLGCAFIMSLKVNFHVLAHHPKKIIKAAVLGDDKAVKPVLQSLTPEEVRDLFMSHHSFRM